MASNSKISLEDLRKSADRATQLLKAMANPDRLVILCTLAEEELCVSDIEHLLGIRQPTLSQQLARLRADDLVATRRDGKVIYYRLASGEVSSVLAVLYDLYCKPATSSSRSPKGQRKAA
ncbi:MAG: ArsR/SmtB family transcription factor [Gammaproteobacteria bacterium]